MALSPAALIRALNLALLARGLNLVTVSLAARAIEWLGELNYLALRVTTILHADARLVGRSRALAAK